MKVYPSFLDIQVPVIEIERSLENVKVKLRLDGCFFLRQLVFFGCLFFHSPIGKKASIRKKGSGGCVTSLEVAIQNIIVAEKGEQKNVRLAAAFD